MRFKLYSARKATRRYIFHHNLCLLLKPCRLCLGMQKLQKAQKIVVSNAKRTFFPSKILHDHWIEALFSRNSEDERSCCCGITLSRSTQTSGFRGKIKNDWRAFAMREIGMENISVRTQRYRHSEPVKLWRSICEDRCRDPEIHEDSSRNYENAVQYSSSFGKFPFIECTLNKKNMSHDEAITHICDRLKIQREDVTFKARKDKIGDTYQRIRIASGINLEHLFNDVKSYFPLYGIHLYNFKGARSSLEIGNEEHGNLFELIISDIKFTPNHTNACQEKQIIEQRVLDWKYNGFVNFYGPEKFGWFRGKEDWTYFLLKGDTLSACYQLLNYTKKKRPWVELLERSLLYPLEVQELVRKEMLLALSEYGVGPETFLKSSFCKNIEPNIDDALVGQREDPSFSNVSPERVLMDKVCDRAVRKALRGDIVGGNAFEQYLWNQTVSYIYQIFGVPKTSDLCRCQWCIAARSMHSSAGGAVLKLDGIIDTDARRSFHSEFLSSDFLSDITSRQSAHHQQGVVCRFDYFHHIYKAIREKYRVVSPVSDFERSYPFVSHYRRIFAHPTHVSHSYSASEKKLFLRFALPQNSCVTSALFQLFQSPSIPLMNDMIRLPTDDMFWHFGSADKNYMPTARDVYSSVSHKDGTYFTELRCTEVASKVHKTHSVRSNSYDEVFLNVLDSYGEPGRRPFDVDDIAQWAKENQISNRLFKQRKAIEYASDRLQIDNKNASGLENTFSYVNTHNIPMGTGQCRSRTKARLAKRKCEYLTHANLSRKDTYSLNETVPKKNSIQRKAQSTHLKKRLPHVQSQITPRYYDVNGSWWNRQYCYAYNPARNIL